MKPVQRHSLFKSLCPQLLLLLIFTPQHASAARVTAHEITTISAHAFPDALEEGLHIMHLRRDVYNTSERLNEWMLDKKGLFPGKFVDGYTLRDYPPVSDIPHLGFERITREAIRQNFIGDAVQLSISREFVSTKPENLPDIKVSRQTQGSNRFSVEKCIVARISLPPPPKTDLTIGDMIESSPKDSHFDLNQAIMQLRVAVFRDCGLLIQEMAKEEMLRGDFVRVEDKTYNPEIVIKNLSEEIGEPTSGYEQVTLIDTDKDGIPDTLDLRIAQEFLFE